MERLGEGAELVPVSYRLSLLVGFRARDLFNSLPLARPLPW